MPPLPRLVLAALAVSSVFLVACRERASQPTAARPALAHPPVSSASSASGSEATPSVAGNATTPTAPNPVEHWRALAALPSTIERDAELAVTLEELAARDPQAAAEMLRGLSDQDRHNVVRALFTDSAHRPERALQLANAFLAADPERSRDHGHALVYVLTHAAEYSAAVRFVLQRSAAGGESEDPVEWLKATFREWAKAEPQIAASQVLALPATSLREEALQSVAGAWAQTDPMSALAFIQQMPLEAERRTGVEAALRAWLENDAAAAMRWLEAAPPSPDFDYPIARLLANERFNDASAGTLALAARIANPELRSHVTAQLLQRLAAKDPRAAAERAETNPNLSASDKAAVLAAAHRPPE